MGVDGMLMNIFLHKMQGGPIDNGQGSTLGKNDVCIFTVQMKAATVY